MPVWQYFCKVTWKDIVTPKTPKIKMLQNKYILIMSTIPGYTIDISFP